MQAKSGIGSGVLAHVIVSKFVDHSLSPVTTSKKCYDIAVQNRVQNPLRNEENHA